MSWRLSFAGGRQPQLLFPSNTGTRHRFAQLCCICCSALTVAQQTLRDLFPLRAKHRPFPNGSRHLASALALPAPRRGQHKGLFMPLAKATLLGRVCHGHRGAAAGQVEPLKSQKPGWSGAKRPLLPALYWERCHPAQARLSAPKTPVNATNRQCVPGRWAGAASWPVPRRVWGAVATQSAVSPAGIAPASPSPEPGAGPAPAHKS